MLTDTALDKFRAFIRRNIYRARYRVGSTWREAAINEVEIQSGGTVRAWLAITPGGAATVTRVELLDSSGATWAYQDVSISVTDQQSGILYWFDFTIKEEAV